jgi:hypothetical protein
MKTHTIEVTGISDELLKLLDERVRQRGGDRAALVRELIQKELRAAPPSSAEEAPPHPAMTFDEILMPVHRHVTESGITDEELDRLFEKAREQVRKQKKAAPSQ